MYNIVDTMIVGRILGSEALAAVDLVYALMVLLIFAILGLCMGSSVVFSKPYGAGKQEKMKTAVYNAFLYILLTTVLLYGPSAIGIGMLFLLYALYRGNGNPGMSIVLTIISLGSRVALADATGT